MLSRKGAVVAEADGGAEALSRMEARPLAGKPYELVLLDCRMPAMDGFQVAQRLRNRIAGPSRSS